MLDNALLCVPKINNEKVLSQFAKKLKTARESRGLTQEDLAEKSGLALSQIARLETGKLNTGIATVYAILKAMNAEANELF